MLERVLAQCAAWPVLRYEATDYTAWYMDDTTNRSASAPEWGKHSSARTRGVVQKSVTALLDELAPERVPRRIEAMQGPVEQHRKPSGCVLQAATCAVSVSWFVDASATSPLGELHVLVWRGALARRGSSRGAGNATLVTELVLRPIEPPKDDCIWESTEGVRYDTASLAAQCLALLEAQVASR